MERRRLHLAVHDDVHDLDIQFLQKFQMVVSSVLASNVWHGDKHEFLRAGCRSRPCCTLQHQDRGFKAGAYVCLSSGGR